MAEPNDAGARRPKLDWLRRNWLRLAVNLGALALLARLGWWVVSDRFAFDPVTQVLIRTGRYAIAFLLLTLTCTPLAVLTGWSRLRRARRPLGLWSLAFTALHLLTFAGWDYAFDPALLRIGIFAQPFVLVGFGTLLILLILGVTSLPRLQRRLGRRWLWVQRLVYLALIMDIWHVVWAKKNVVEAWGYIAIGAGLLTLRLPPVRDLLVRAGRVLRHTTSA
jgi:methionine sulfoxide reductase heme-binding subunit